MNKVLRFLGDLLGAVIALIFGLPVLLFLIMIAVVCFRIIKFVLFGY